MNYSKILGLYRGNNLSGLIEELKGLQITSEVAESLYRKGLWPELYIAGRKKRMGLNTAKKRVKEGKLLEFKEEISKLNAFNFRMHRFKKGLSHVKRSWLIYVIENKYIPELVKIGYTGNIVGRLFDLNMPCSVPGKFELLSEIQVKSELEAKLIELKIHEKLKAYRITKEFFSTDCLSMFGELKKSIGFIN